MSDKPSPSEQAHAKLDAILDKLTKLEERETTRQSTLDSILASMNYCAETLGTLVVEVAELAKAAAAEPKSDNGDILRKLAEAVEKNTASITALAAQLAARRGGTH